GSQAPPPCELGDTGDTRWLVAPALDMFFSLKDRVEHGLSGGRHIRGAGSRKFLEFPSRPRRGGGGARSVPGAEPVPPPPVRPGDGGGLLPRPPARGRADRRATSHSRREDPRRVRTAQGPLAGASGTRARSDRLDP